MEIPNNIADTQTLFNPMTIEGASLVETMAEIGLIAQELYDEEPDFVALVPFGSRTKGLARNPDSDLDIYMIVEQDILKAAWLNKLLEKKWAEHKIPWRLHIISSSRSHYECILSGMGSNVIDSNILGVPFWPNKLGESITISRRSSQWMKTKILPTLMNKIEESEREAAEKKITNKETVNIFVSNRMHLWRNRFIKLLDYNEDIDD